MKGRELERLVRDHLTEEGWRVHLVAARSQTVVRQPDGSPLLRNGRQIFRSTSHDLFGAWDGIALGREFVLFFQVTTVGQGAAHRRKIDEAGPWWDADGNIQFRLYMMAEEKSGATGRRRKVLRVQKRTAEGWSAPWAEAIRRPKRPQPDRGRGHLFVEGESYVPF